MQKFIIINMQADTTLETYCITNPIFEAGGSHARTVHSSLQAIHGNPELPQSQMLTCKSQFSRGNNVVISFSPYFNGHHIFSCKLNLISSKLQKGTSLKLTCSSILHWFMHHIKTYVLLRFFQISGRLHIFTIQILWHWVLDIPLIVLIFSV